MNSAEREPYARSAVVPAVVMRIHRLSNVLLKNLARLASCLGFTAALFSGTSLMASSAPHFDAIYAFGDSLTDTWNEPAEPYLHFDGRWSNGPLWIEHLSERFGFAYIETNNYAHSGAQCDDTFGQVRRFTPSGPLSNALFVVWAGGNDFLQEYDKYWLDDSGWDTQTAYSVSGLSNAVVTLHEKGARFVLVPNTVDVTEIPTINYLPDFLRDYLRDKVKLFNSRLAVALDALEAQLPDMEIYRCDTFAKMQWLLRHAKAYGFTEKNIDALADLTLLDKSFDGPGANYVFWDPIHPTTKAHALVADWFHAAVDPLSPQISIQCTGGTIGFSAANLHLTGQYELQQSTNWSEWTAVQSITCTSAVQGFSVTISNAIPSAFFRMCWTP